MIYWWNRGAITAGFEGDSTLARIEEVEITRISDAVRRYKVGITEDPGKNR